MIEEYNQRFNQAISRLQHALDDTDLIRKLTVEYLQDIAQPINAKAQELTQLESQVLRRRAELNDLDEQIKQRQCELEWSGSQQEYVIRQLRAAIQTVNFEEPYHSPYYDRKRYANQIQTSVTRAINRRINDLLVISRLRLSNKKIDEYDDVAKESRRKLANELRHARNHLRELKTIKSQHWREVETSERFLEAIKSGFAPVPPPLLGADQIIKNGTAVPNKSGIYFLWEGPLVAYVGQSTNLARRLFMHPQLQPNDKISYLCIDSSELFYQEAFYIGLCRPSRNGVGARKMYQKLSENGSYSP